MNRITVSLAMSLIMGFASNVLAGDCSNEALRGTYAFRSEATVHSREPRKLERGVSVRSL
jgi:hypothetical protein